jgi:HK97 family phage prohead protease
MIEKREYRFLPGAVRVREVDGKPTLFTGRAVVYNSWSELIYGHFRERILPGTFDESLSDGHDIVATIDHDMHRLLGRTQSSTLRLQPGPEGVDVGVDYPDLSYARDLAVSIGRGDIRGMSFIFDILDDSWETIDGVPHRSVSKADIFEVTFTGFPAYPDTEAGMRAVKRAMECQSVWFGESDLDWRRRWLRWAESILQ